MKLLFVNLSSLVFDAATPEREPLGGTESCVCYLARQLARGGHAVTLTARLPPNTPDEVMGVRHRPVAVIKDRGFFDAEKFDAIVTGNAAIACPRFREYSPGSLNIFWDHLPPDQPAVELLGHPEVRASIDGIAYVSAWQKTGTETRFGAAYPSRIIANGLTPAFENMFASRQGLLNAKQNRAAYTSVPYRGLSVLLAAMQGLNEETGLDVFSSMRVYQTGDEDYAAIFRQAQSNPHVTCHGSVSQTELAAKLKPAAFLAYPCIMPETFCLAVLEALAAGMKVIATDAGGIKATAMDFADLLPVNEGIGGERLALSFRQVLERNIAAFKAAPDAWAERMFEQVQTVNRSCAWTARAKEWEDFLAALMRKKSLIETRRSSG